MSVRRDMSGGACVGAVITAFNPDHQLLEACRSVMHQVDATVVVDDGSGAPNEAVLDMCRELGAVVSRHTTNRGIGAALNTGVRVARERLGGSGTYILTLDQDSLVPAGYVDALVAAERAATSAGQSVGMVGPERAQGIRSAAARSVGGILHSREPIQSGLLIPTATFDAIGVFADNLFIDGVDSEFFLRATTRGRSAIVARGAKLGHHLGREHVVSVGGRPLALGARRLGLVHAADYRYYYIARNRVILLRRYARTAPAWSISAVLRDLRHLAVTTAFVPGRWNRLSNTVVGLRDGLRGIDGPRPGADRSSAAPGQPRRR